MSYQNTYNGPNQNKPDFLAKTREVKSPWKNKLLNFLMVMGPGLIVMVADNDAGAVSTYTQAGAQYGYHLMWMLLLLLPVTYFMQEMVVRLGIATGKGQAAMIYQRFGKRWGRFSLLNLELVNFFTLVSEFALISLACAAMGISPYISVTFSVIGLIFLVTSGSYLKWERVVLFLCLLDLAWLYLLFSSHPNMSSVLGCVFFPTRPEGGFSSLLVYMMIAIVGTTVAPWQLFFQQSIIADKKLRYKDLKNARIDTLIGAIITIAVAGCMMIVGNVLHTHNIVYVDPSQMALSLKPIMGTFAKNALLLLSVNASILGTVTISLSSSFAYAESRGWSHSLQNKMSAAPGFYVVYILAVIAAGAIVLIPRAPLQVVIIGIQVLAGVMLPAAIVFLQIMLSDKDLLGDRFVNKPWNNYVNWTIVVVLFLMSFVLAAQILLPGIFK